MPRVSQLTGTCSRRGRRPGAGGQALPCSGQEEMEVWPALGWRGKVLKVREREEEVGEGRNVAKLRGLREGMRKHCLMIYLLWCSVCRLGQLRGLLLSPSAVLFLWWLLPALTRRSGIWRGFW